MDSVNRFIDQIDLKISRDLQKGAKRVGISDLWVKYLFRQDALSLYLAGIAGPALTVPWGLCSITLGSFRASP